ncbi:BamA/TamA family outer membrane protein [Candidatus Poribacteria bacterium]|nr:BamA/TamA family outer membrane protein [Candidatus Poribacteria bacterium]
MKYPIFALLVCLTMAQLTWAESPPARTGFSVAGLPLTNYNSDEGLGYGANLALYNYASGGYSPYFYLTQAEVFLTTRGKDYAFLFFDSPHLIPQYRLSAELRFENDVFSPFYGVGEQTKFDKDFTDESAKAFIDEHYYSFGRERLKLTADLQRFVWQRRLRALVGLGVFRTEITPNEKRSLLREQGPLGIEGGWTNYLKFGLVYDTRDNEPAPTRGAWSEVIVETSNKLLGSDYTFNRVTVTDRRYYRILKELVYANRVVFETMSGDVPFYEMSPFASSFKREEGLGGAKSMRGLPRNRFIGKTKLFANLELRWTMFRFQKWNQDFFVATNIFADIGRVWKENPTLTLKDFQLARGGGVRLGWNQNFIVAVDVGNSKEAPFALYIGLGYLY